MTVKTDEEFIAEIARLRAERGAVILAHNYQRPEIQDIADFTGDSLGLSRQAAATEADVIIFCGVHFMAETAYILSPDKVVVLPEIEAGCMMADMITVDGLLELKAAHPGVPVVCYVNSSAAVKAESDICCTSANAVAVANAIDADEIIMIPDRNLGYWVAQQTGKKVIPWDGFCPTHEYITVEQVEAARKRFPDAVVMVHPECRPEVTAIADAVLSTSQMFGLAATSDATDFIVGTELGIGHGLAKANPAKCFHFPTDETICPNMKVITLAKVAESLATLQPRVTVDEETRLRALAAVQRMVELG